MGHTYWSMQKNNKTGIIFIFCILIIALLIRLPHLFDKEKGTDEKLSIRNAEIIKNFNFSLKDYAKVMPHEANPPLFFIILAISLIFYNSIVSLKIVVLIISLLSIIAFYILSKEIFGDKFALFSTLLYSLNPIHLILSQHIRTYILLFLLFNLSLYFLYRLLIKGDKKSQVYLIILNIISIYIHYYSVLFIISEVITAIFFYKTIKKDIKSYIISIIIIGLMAIPAIILLKTQLNYTSGWGLEKVTFLTLGYPLYKFSLMVDVSTIIKKFPYIF